MCCYFFWQAFLRKKTRSVHLASILLDKSFIPTFRIKIYPSTVSGILIKECPRLTSFLVKVVISSSFSDATSKMVNWNIWLGLCAFGGHQKAECPWIVAHNFNLTIQTWFGCIRLSAGTLSASNKCHLTEESLRL
jgi:hypothetical protein